MKIAPQTYYRWRACPVRPTELEVAYLVNQIVNIYRQNKCVYGVRKMWHAARRAGVPVGREVGRLMRIAGIQGVRRGLHRTVTTTRDERAPDTLTWSNVAGRRRTGRMRCGSRISPTCGRPAGSATCRSSPMSIPDAFWDGGRRRARPPTWSPRRWLRRSRPGGGRVASSLHEDWCTIPMLVRNIPL
jgi:hypothetical protein